MTARITSEGDSAPPYSVHISDGFADWLHQAGIALAVKGLSPSTSVHAGEPAGFDDLARSLAAGTRQKNDKLSGSICDALLAPTPGDVTFPLARALLGPGLVVSDEEVLDAMELAFREFKLVVEPGGAVALAAALTGKLPVKGRAVAVICSGPCNRRFLPLPGG